MEKFKQTVFTAEDTKNLVNVNYGNGVSFYPTGIMRSAAAAKPPLAELEVFRFEGETQFLIRTASNYYVRAQKLIDLNSLKYDIELIDVVEVTPPDMKPNKRLLVAVMRLTPVSFANVPPADQNLFIAVQAFVINVSALSQRAIFDRKNRVVFEFDTRPDIKLKATATNYGVTVTADNDMRITINIKDTHEGAQRNHYRAFQGAELVSLFKGTNRE